MAVVTLLKSDLLRDSVVGIAWGGKPASHPGGDQHIGDILVATQLVDASYVKAIDGRIEVRGDVATSPLALSVTSQVCRNWPHMKKVHIGAMVSHRL